MKKLYILFLLVLPGIGQKYIQARVHVFGVPGINKLGSDPEYIKGLLGESTEVTMVKTPEKTPDLGQDNCLALIRSACQKKPIPSIIHATSQGTATALNYMAEDKGRYIKAVILEAPLASGNSAIYHQIGGRAMNLPLLTKIPGSYYWLPYCAKIKFPYYSPSGTQPFDSIKKIPTHIPIIIVHSKDDTQTSYTDSCALYYGLCSRGNKNVYFVTREGKRHIKIMKYDPDKIIANILKHHKLIEGTTTINVDDYRVNHVQFKKYYDELCHKERVHKRARQILQINIISTLKSNIVYYRDSLHNAFKRYFSAVKTAN